MSDTPLTDERTFYTSELSAIPPKQSNAAYTTANFEFRSDCIGGMAERSDV